MMYESWKVILELSRQLDREMRKLAVEAEAQRGQHGETANVRELQVTHVYLTQAHDALSNALTHLNQAGNPDRAYRLVHPMYLDYASIEEQSRQSTLTTIDTAKYVIIPKEGAKCE